MFALAGARGYSETMIRPGSISIIIPAYNERATVEPLIHMVSNLALANVAHKEIVVVNDGSNDGTERVLERLARELPVRVLHHPRNIGKGAALRSGLRVAEGEYVIFQDADLEYDPHDYQVMLAPLLEGRADVVYGSRFLRRDAALGSIPWLSRVANGALTACSNWVTGMRITDMETGYKAFRRAIFDDIRIEENGFGVEPELTAKIAPAVLSGGIDFVEVPVSYNPRSRSAGKKIRFRDGLWALRCMFRYRQTAGAALRASMPRVHR